VNIIMTMKKVIAVAFASAALMANVVAPAFAASTTLEITGNGADSSNAANVSVAQNTVVSQTNTANITNDVNATANTGNNDANRNTGGHVSVDTGDAKTLVGVSNTANTNAADVTNCNCGTDAKVLISGNGAGSDNAATLGLASNTIVAQSNNADITNRVDADASTGYNRANRNTGGSVEVTTGKALTNVEIMNNANANWAKVGGNGQNNGSVSLMILGNGADSDNSIALGLSNDVLLQQYNAADIFNNVNADASTGYNRANRNTGGSTSVDTGNAHAGVVIDNAANFNAATVDCDCVTDVTAKVAGNGTDTESTIGATLSSGLNVFQDNSCSANEWSFAWRWNDPNCIENHLNADADTGANKGNRNTGNPGVDPSITTGNAETLVASDTTGNANIFGDAPHAPTMGTWNGVNLNISFNLNDILHALGMSL
jgi:hypothetical protein